MAICVKNIAQSLYVVSSRGTERASVCMCVQIGANRKCFGVKRQCRVPTSTTVCLCFNDKQSYRVMNSCVHCLNSRRRPIVYQQPRSACVSRINLLFCGRGNDVLDSFR